MIGAILGDMIGAPYEFDRGDKTKAFPLFSAESKFTDDSVMTVAVAEALLDYRDGAAADLGAALVNSLRKWGHKYPHAGYGARFSRWLFSADPAPYNSFGNGSAMRVSAAGWLYGTLDETRAVARATAAVTHNHPEGIKGAEATASAIYLARTGSSKDEIKAYIVREFGYDLSRTVDEIRPTYHHVESCQQSVPEAITAFLEGESFEDVIRTAVSIGGDTDTVACIAGGVAEAFYGVPAALRAACLRRVPPEFCDVIARFDKARGGAESLNAPPQNNT
ncbi:MAG: ADP-ribosylglycohydrolase family protein [Clostridia bacterium]|nr:ADP-ribosylglycohydrolase family protein [Clostridia bacterium]